MVETLALVSSVAVMLMLDTLLARVRGSQRTARAATRSFVHARPMTRSRLMAHPL